MSKTCSAFGHRKLFEDIGDIVYEAVESAIELGYTEFLTGDMGEFDRVFSSAVRKAKKEHPEIKLVCVIPYITETMREYKEIYCNDYDELVIPEKCVSAHYKAKITTRNRWMVDNSDLVIFYTFKEYGGAYETRQYTQRQNKEIMEIPNRMSNLQKAVILMAEKELNHLKEESISIDNMSMFQKTVILMDDEWLDSLENAENCTPSEKRIRFIKKHFGVDLSTE